jgi:hypothetical protein
VSTRLLFALLFTFFILACSSIEKKPPADCFKLRQGSFSYRLDDNWVAVERTATEQTESFPSTGLFMKFRINWKSDCEYELVLSKYFQDGNVLELDTGEVPSVQVKIIEVKANYFVTMTKTKGNSPSRDTLRINSLSSPKSMNETFK